MTDAAGPLGRIYTLDEAAAYLRTTKQAVARAAHKSGAGARFGRDIRFNEDDVRALWEAMRTRVTGHVVREPVSRPFAEAKAWASLRKMAEVKRNARIVERERRKEANQRLRESEKAARLGAAGKSPRKPNPPTS